MLIVLAGWLVSSHFFVFKQKTAYEMRISDWSSDVCSSDLGRQHINPSPRDRPTRLRQRDARHRTHELHRSIGARKGILRGNRRRRSPPPEIGRASCRERVCQYVSISVVDVSLKTKTRQPSTTV